MKDKAYVVNVELNEHLYNLYKNISKGDNYAGINL